MRRDETIELGAEAALEAREWWRVEKPKMDARYAEQMAAIRAHWEADREAREARLAADVSRPPQDESARRTAVMRAAWAEWGIR